jgi:hypothetical protein
LWFARTLREKTQKISITNQETVQTLLHTPAFHRKLSFGHNLIRPSSFLPSLSQSKFKATCVVSCNGPSASCASPIVVFRRRDAASSTAFWIRRIAKDTHECVTIEHLQVSIWLCWYPKASQKMVARRLSSLERSTVGAAQRLNR